MEVRIDETKFEMEELGVCEREGITVSGVEPFDSRLENKSDDPNTLIMCGLVDELSGGFELTSTGGLGLSFRIDTSFNFLGFSIDICNV